MTADREAAIREESRLKWSARKRCQELEAELAAAREREQKALDGWRDEMELRHDQNEKLRKALRIVNDSATLEDAKWIARAALSEGEGK